MTRSFLIIVGAPKSGTTSLAKWLQQHPSIQVHPSKEPRFFTDFSSHRWQGPGAGEFRAGIVADEQSYLAAFGDPQARWLVDASTDYLWHELARQKILDWSKRFRTKVVCILRDPLDRLISEYRHTLRDHLEDQPILRSLELEDTRVAKKWQPLFYHRRRSLYSHTVPQYQGTFGNDLLILSFDELREPRKICERVFRFLDLPAIDLKDATPENESSTYQAFDFGPFRKSPTIQKIARLVIPTPLRGTLRNATQRTYRPNLSELATLSQALADESKWYQKWLDKEGRSVPNAT